MLRLSIDHPDLHKRFQSGCHTVSRSPTESTLNMVSTDMALEQSMNRDTKTKGGIIGISQDYDAVEKWTLSSHLRAAVYSKFKELCDVKLNKMRLSMKRIEKDETAVKKIVSKIEEEFINPFNLKENEIMCLTNIISGAVVQAQFRTEILTAKDIGETKAVVFITERIINKEVSFWDPVKRLNLSTFSSTDKIKVSRKNEPAIIFKNQQSLFSRLLSVSTFRPVDLKATLTYELSAVPLSLFHPGGEMRKTAKSQLLHELETSVESSSNLEGDQIIWECA